MGDQRIVGAEWKGRPSVPVSITPASLRAAGLMLVPSRHTGLRPQARSHGCPLHALSANKQTWV